MTGRLDGNVAIVTGGSRGIGRAISVALAAEGANVVLAALNADASAAPPSGVPLIHVTDHCAGGTSAAEASPSSKIKAIATFM